MVVTFNPRLNTLTELLERLLPQVSRVIVVDNGSSIDIRECECRSHPQLRMILLGDNHGIGAAQNIGIAAALHGGARYILLSDQDSQPALNMICCLKAAALELMGRGIKVAAVGPRFVDVNQRRPEPFMRIKGLTIQKHWCSGGNAVVEVDYLIASGCLIPAEAMRAVGAMREEIFIDYVDVEWGLRAGKFGYRSYGVCAAAMLHRHGDAPISFMGRQYLAHSPLRHYYRFRNAVWLYRQKHVPLHWKMVDAIRLLKYYVFYSLLARPQLTHWKMMTLGLFHGVRSRLGRLDRS